MLDPKLEFSEERSKRFIDRAAALIPNVLTFIAILCGLTALRLSGEHLFGAAMAAIFAAVVLDIADGFAARRLNAVSALGAELDSLADFLNFGVAPAMLLYQRDLVALGWAGWLVAAVYAAAAGLRLAKFNILSRTPYSGSGKRNFRGLPSTAAATGVLAAIAAVRLGTASGFEPLALAVTSLFLAALMLSNLNVPALTTLLRIERQGT